MVFKTFIMHQKMYQASPEIYTSDKKGLGTNDQIFGYRI